MPSAPWKKQGQFRIVLVSNALAETGRSAEELIAVHGVQELTVARPNEKPKKALRVPNELLLDSGEEE
jgi:hypothetical protein